MHGRDWVNMALDVLLCSMRMVCLTGAQCRTHATVQTSQSEGWITTKTPACGLQHVGIYLSVQCPQTAQTMSCLLEQQAQGAVESGGRHLLELAS